MVFFASVQGAAEAEKGFDISPPGGYNKQVFTCGVSTSVVRRLPKPNRRVRLPYPAPRRNGLRSIQKARSQDRAFLIPLCHSSFSPRNFALQTSAGAPAASRHVIASAISLAAIFCQNHRALILLLLTSPRNFALQTFAGAPAASRHVIASAISLAAIFCQNHRALILLLLTSPRNFALQTFAGAPAASRHVIASVMSLAAAFVRSHRALFAPPPRQAAKHKRPLACVDFSK